MNDLKWNVNKGLICCSKNLPPHSFSFYYVICSPPKLRKTRIFSPIKRKKMRLGGIHHFPMITKFINSRTGGLPWWRSGWESACQCRGHGFEPWSEKIPHAVEQLGPWATTTEPARLEPVLRNKRGRDNEKPVHRDEEWPPLAATRESPRTETKTQHSHK